MDFDNKPEYFMADGDDNKQSTQPSTINFDNDINAKTEANEPQQPAREEKPHRRRRAWKRIFWWSVVIIALVLAAATWIRYFNPYVTDATERGYIVSMERRGIVFKTWEGQMIVQSALTDSTRLYSRDFIFSVDNPELAKMLVDVKGTGRQVNVTYKRYWGSLPWRGATCCIITAVEPVATTKAAEASTPADNMNNGDADAESPVNKI